jgi:hypothetical protein
MNAWKKRPFTTFHVTTFMSVAFMSVAFIDLNVLPT